MLHFCSEIQASNYCIMSVDMSFLALNNLFMFILIHLHFHCMQNNSINIYKVFD